MASSARAARAVCDSCLRPQKLCLCDVLPADRPLWTRTRIVILVHPKEIKRKLGTLPLLKLCLQDLVIREGEHFPEPSEDPELHELLAEGGHQPMFLCPGPDAKELAPVETSTTDPVEDAPDLDTKASLIFIDGTWRQAKGMVMRSPWLREHVPRAVIRPSGHSGYRFRKQPEQGCLSTLEAVAEALWALEGHRGAELKSLLLAPFHRMVELQCAFIRALEDKNVPVEQTRLLFDPEAALKALGEGPATEVASQPGDPSPEVYCILRWGERAVADRPVIVMDVLRATHSKAKLRSQELSAGRTKGSRCWFRLLGEVPPGALWEEAPRDPEEVPGHDET